MKWMQRRTPFGDVGRLLRRGDPAADGREPSAEELRLVRARVLEEARNAPRRAPRGLFRPAVALGWVAVVCVAVLVAAGTVQLRRTAPPMDAEEVTAGDGAVRAAPRQVQFTTPGGTRIVWVLYPDTP